MNNELQNCQQTEPCTVEEIRNSLEQSEKGKVYNTAANYKRVLQYDPLLKGAIRKNLLTERIDIVKSLGWYRDSPTLTDVDVKYLLGHDYDEPKQWELREINDIMNNAVTGWRAFSNPRYFPEPYRRQKGWERIRNDNEPDNSMDGFQEIPTEEMEQLGLPEEWLKQK